MDIVWGPGGSAEIAYRQERVRRDVAAARGTAAAARRSGDRRAVRVPRRTPRHGAPTPAAAGT